MTRALAAMLVAAALAVGGAGAATPTPRSGGTLVVAVLPSHVPNCLNPFGPCNALPFKPAISQVLEGAFELGPDLVLRPNLVSRVDVGRRPLTLTYHIRPAASWSDGVPVSSEDFRFTYEVLRTHRFTGPVTDRRDDYRKIRRFRVLGPKTFRLELQEPVGDWRGAFEIVLPAHALQGEDVTTVWRTRIENPKSGRPIGSGPFLTSALDPGRRLTLVRNPRYWRRAAYLDRIALLAEDPTPERGIAAAAGAHDVDGLACCFPASAVRPLRGWSVLTYQKLLRERFAFRLGPGGHAALRDRRVRQAIAHGIDRREINRRLEAALGGRIPVHDSSVYHAGEPGYRPNWRGYRYDPARARGLLERAGCRRGGDGIYSCGGERLSLRLATTAGTPPRRRIVELAQEQLQRVGVEVRLVYFAGPVTAFLARGEWDLSLNAWNVGPGGVAAPDVLCGHEFNWTGYCSRLVQRDLDQVPRILDPRQRARVLNAADTKLARDVPVLPLQQQLENAAFRTRVRGVVPGGSFEQMFERSEDWWLAP